MHEPTLEEKELFLRIQDETTGPELFFNEILGAKLDDQQREMIRGFGGARRICVKSGHSNGKDFCAARLGLWFHVTHYPSIVIFTGPCYDDKTEILTDRGWKLFRDLDRSEKVASLVDGEMKFVTPLDWMDFPSPGEMVGYRGRDVDFLVSPNHRLYVSRFGSYDGPKHRWGFREARECYGQFALHFNREVRWAGRKDAWSEKHYELFGFWFADGYARCGPDSSGHRRYEVTLTQAFFPEYAIDLLSILGQRVLTSKRVGEAHWLPSWNFTIRGKKWAQFFCDNFYRDGKKYIPDWVLSATSEKLKAFIRGFYVGDGDKSGQPRIRSNRVRIYADKEFADRIQIAGMKAGFVVNLHGPRYRDGDVLKERPAEWSCTFLQTDYNDKSFPKTHSQHWYKQPYDGRIYCVKVPSGIIMVRRNGVYHWSGNTDRQVRQVVWGELKAAYRQARYPIGGEMLETMLKSGDPRHYMIGFTASTPEAFQGFHSDNVLVVVTEAPGVSSRMWPGIISLLTAKDNARLFCLGNATYDPESEFYAMFTRNASLYRQFTLDSEKSSYCSKEWIAEMKTEFGEESGIYQARVKGIFPTDVADTLIPLAWIERAYSKWAEPTLSYQEAPFTLGVDVARFGTDQTCFVAGQGNRYRIVHAVQGQDLMETAGRVAQQINGGVPAPHVRVDDTGLGGGVTDRLRELGHKISAINFGGKPSDDVKFANARSEMFWLLRERFRTGDIAIDPRDTKLLRDLSVLKSKMTSKGQIKLEEKAEAKARLGYSPDRADALALAALPQPTAEQLSQGIKSGWGLLEYMRREAEKNAAEAAEQRGTNQNREPVAKRPMLEVPGAAAVLGDNHATRAPASHGWNSVL